jgi:FkbM family methyltransferase
MDQECRTGVDVRVALLTHMKRALVAAVSRSADPLAEGQAVNAPAVPAPPGRSMALAPLRLFKALLRPVLSRVRRYFTVRVHEELDRMRDEMRAIQQAQREEQQAVIRLIKSASTDAQQKIAQLEAAMVPRLEQIEQYGYASARRVAVPCGADAVLVRSVVGYVLCPATDYSQLACLLDTGEMERGTRLLLERLLAPGDSFVDVGANLGLHTLAAARAMKGRGSIVAFEPFASTFELMQRTIWLNGFSEMVEGHRSAAFNRSGQHELHLGLSSGHHSLFPVGEGPEVERTQVSLVKLDDALASRATVDVIKIDAEGAELEVVEGARALIERSPEIALVVEFGPSHLRRTGRPANEWFEQFARLGLKYRAIQPVTGALEDRSVEQLDSLVSANLLFARPQARAWRKAEAPS